MTEQSSVPDNTEIFKQLEEYQWDKDPQFQGGLSAILGNAKDPNQVQELTLRAQCFYLSRKKSISIDFDAYKAYLAAKHTAQVPTAQVPSETAPQSTPTATSSEHAGNAHDELDVPPASPSPDTNTTTPPPSSDKGAAAPYPPTFAEIVELITSGAPIPGIKEIPPTLLTSQATKPSVAKRRKPWEKDLPEDVVQGVGMQEGEGDQRNVEGTFGDRRDKIVIQDLPEE